MNRTLRGLSRRSRYRRFHGTLSELSPAMLEQLTRIDYVRHLALVAETFVGGVTVLVGEARFARDEDPASAEFAIAVADPWQGRGVGRMLMRSLLRAAAAKGLRRLYGKVLHDNRPMLTLARELGFGLEPCHDDPGLVQVAIDPAATESPFPVPAIGRRRSWLDRLAGSLPLAWRGDPAASPAARAVA